MIDPLTYLIVCPLVFLAGLIDSAAGGGGLISLPAYLAGGLPTRLAAGTNKFSACIGSVSANIAYIKSGNMPWKPALLGVAGALPGAAIGARLLLLVASADIVIRVLLLVAVPVVAFLVFRAKDGEMPPPTGWRALPLAGILLPVVIGFGVGLYDGFFGPGTGTFLALSLRGALGLTWLRATAAAKLVNLSSNLASLTVFLFSGQVVLTLGLATAAFSIAGNLIGARIAVRGGGKAIRVMLIIALTLLLARVVWDLIGGIAG